MLLRASYWTWKLLNGESIPDEMPTAYLMLDGKCMYNCAYCTHAKDSESDNSYLSRIVWKIVNVDSLNSVSSKFKRVCIQTVNYKGYLDDIIEVIKHLRSSNENNDLLISVSTRVKNEEEIDTLMNSGVDDLGMAIDVASKGFHMLYRSWPLEYTLSLIRYGASRYPGRITTHIIVGLGETDRELYEIFKLMKSYNVKIALFAFTPVRGTKLAHLSPPSIERYRNIQLLRFLIFEANQKPDVDFDEFGNLKSVRFDSSIDVSKAFLTSGCTHCTRPYYNDSPRSKVLYNYHVFKNSESR
ncbi:biotin synthase [Fervidobacterium changbaicum]|uniref:Radical SAM protein n=2 Tax=Fervidobacterium TaxID=2422 RepID=A0AAI8CKW5_FERIS|nr:MULTISPECIES: radical SAM protein [Fervidobacterium]AMW32814.1 radical SAM protein [Fervidobacterium islandicum]QAV32852.1 radical SAM protein [Fervidobacterium changbaicum]SDH53638.1 biotin synthase [Fervidobacterium changbaicum]